MVLGAEFEGFRFASSNRFEESGEESAGYWTYEATGPGTGLLRFTFDEGDVQIDYELVFVEPDQGTYRSTLSTGGVTDDPVDGAFNLDFDFFQLPRDPETHQRESFWFGRFDNRHFDHANGTGWIWHHEHGWLWAAGRGASESLWLWDHIQQDWLWTRADVYPFLFKHNNEFEGYWLYYDWKGGTPALRWFYDYRLGDEGEWVDVRKP